MQVPSPSSCSVAWLCRCFTEVERLDYIVAVLSRTQHNGFPVVGQHEDITSEEGVQSSSEGVDDHDQGCCRNGPLQGLILRSQLLVLLAEQVKNSVWTAKYVFACVVLFEAQEGLSKRRFCSCFALIYCPSLMFANLYS